MIPSIITIISGNLSQNSGGYNSDIIGIRDIICFSNKSGILPGTYFVTSHHMFSIISGILGIFSHSVGIKEYVGLKETLDETIKALLEVEKSWN